MTKANGGRRPSHEGVYVQLRDRIDSGEFAVGAAFPTEIQLCAELGASRYAVRGALQQLEEEGFLSRRRGAGTTVLRHTPIETFRHAVGSRTDLLNYAHATHMLWDGREGVRADGQLARLLGCDEMREWHCLQGVRHDDQNMPLCIVRVYIDATRATIPADVDFSDDPVYEWLDRNYGIKPVGLSQDIRAKQLTPTEANKLGEPVGVCALQIIRRYFDSNNSIYLISVNTFRSRDFVYNMRLELKETAG
ncbi:GntR family transcriptional regulator [Parapedomonas caeni]